MDHIISSCDEMLRDSSCPTPRLNLQPSTHLNKAPAWANVRGNGQRVGTDPSRLDVPHQNSHSTGPHNSPSLSTVPRVSLPVPDADNSAPTQAPPCTPHTLLLRTILYTPHCIDIQLNNTANHKPRTRTRTQPWLPRGSSAGRPADPFSFGQLEMPRSGSG